jgi:hypothetical protein
MEIKMNEQLKILEMLEKGQITSAEAMELLEALNTTKESEPVQPMVISDTGRNHNYKFLKIKVNSENNTVNVNVNIPIRLLTTLGELASKLNVIIPSDVRKEMENKGIDISNINFSQIIKDILNGTSEDPNIINVEAWDEEHKSMVKVKVYVE